VSDLRFVITGAGLVTAVGATRAATFDALARGDRGIGPVELFDTTGQRSRIAAEVRGITRPEGNGEAASWSRTSAMALEAAREAVREAKLDTSSARVGLVVGGTTAGMLETESLLARLHRDPSARDALAQMLSHPLTSPIDRLADALGPFARVTTLSSACSSGANALVVAAAWLLEGDLDAVVAGGADGLCRLTFTGFNSLNALDPAPCRPFDKGRRGLTLGEGAGFVVLERAERARSRGARVIAELAGWSSGAEAHHITNPDPTGDVVVRLIGDALACAGLAPKDLGYVNAHATATPTGDPIEAAAIRRALGDAVDAIPVSSSKGQIGHTLGAAGAIEAVLAAMTIERGVVLPTAGLDEPDEACALLHVPNVGRPARVRAAMSNSFGFGGMDAVLVLSEPGLGSPKRAISARSVVVTGAAALTPRGLDAGGALASLVEPGAEGTTVEGVDARLDAARARRLDRAARLATVAVEEALRSADAIGKEAGVVLASAFGSVDASAAYLNKLFEKGARLASPAEFPNLVPSSPTGHASIYLGLHGASFLVADLATSGEAAVCEGVRLVRAGVATRIVAGAYEERCAIVESVLASMFGDESTAPRGEGAAALVLESSEVATARGVKVLAKVVRVADWRKSFDPAALGAPADATAAWVVMAHEAGEALVEASAWRGCPRKLCAVGGAHEALGAIAMAAAVGVIVRGDAREVLVLGMAADRGHAMVLAAP
jgi:3-oxoacyl-[acyl-carrier-protein] synthase II